MREFTEKYVKAFNTCGTMLAVLVILKDEEEDPFTKDKSKVSLHPEHAKMAVLESVIDIPHSIFRSMLAGSLLIDCLYPIPDIFTPLPATPSSSQAPPSSQPSSSQQAPPSSASTQDTATMITKSWEVQQILDIRETDDHVTEYQLKWVGYVTPTWESLGSLFQDGQYTCLKHIIEFHQANPTKPPSHNIGDMDQRLIPVEEPVGENETADEKAKRENHVKLGIYGHFFVTVTPDENLYRNPPTTAITQILDTMEEYCRDYPKKSPGFKAHQILVREVDYPDDKFDLNPPNLKTQGAKRHLETAKAKRVTQVQEFIKVHRTEIMSIPAADLHKPYPLAITEVGLASNFKTRRAQHATHSGTTALLAFFECVALYLFDGAYRWVFQPLSWVRDGSHYAICENFWSRALQSYWYQGGVNITMAGGSAAGALLPGLIDRSWALDKMDFASMDENLAWAARRMKVIEYVKIMEACPDVDEQLEDVNEQIRKKSAAYYTGAFKLFNNVAQVYEKHMEMLEHGKKLDEDIAAIDHVLDLRRQLDEMIASGEAYEKPNES